MRSSKFLLATQKETPSDAEIISHKLMLRAGMVRRVSAGIYDWLPLGLRVLRKIETIVRQEMNASGAQEVLLPAAARSRAGSQSKDHPPIIGTLGYRTNQSRRTLS